MKLYHGMCWLNADAVRREGLRPRGMAASQWDEMPSSADMVYLTDVWALFHSFNAAMNVHDGMQPPPTDVPPLCVVEIDVDRLNPVLLLPDEDYIVYKNGYGGNRRYTAKIRAKLGSYQRLWHDSLRRYGSIGYRGVIPPEAITRIVVRTAEEIGSSPWLGPWMEMVVATRPHIREYSEYGVMLALATSLFMDGDPPLPPMPECTGHDNLAGSPPHQASDPMTVSPIS